MGRIFGKTRHAGTGCLAKFAAHALAVSRSHLWQLQLRTNTPIQRSEGGDGIETDHLSNLFLRQFDHFDLRDSHISFITLSGQRAELAIPQLTAEQ